MQDSIVQDSVFTKIINGELPCHAVYEDDDTFAFMDIHPIQPGQVLVVPKRQVANFYELPAREYQAFFATVQQIALRLRTVFPAKKRIGLMIEGLDVDHVHAKLFPIDTGDEYRAQPNMAAEPNHADLARLATQLRNTKPTAVA